MTRRRVIPFSAAERAPVDARGAPGPPGPSDPPNTHVPGDGERLEGMDDAGWAGLSGVRVMVVEHDQDTREALAMALEHWGATVAAFSSPVDAGRELDAAPPDAVIVALRMPGDPFALLAAIRRRDGAAHRHTPVLAITTDALDRRRAASAGLHLCVTRPIDHARLRLALANLVGGAA